MRILITGGMGFVGRHFALKFLERDEHEVLIVDSLYSGLPPNLWYRQPRYGERLTTRQADVRAWFRERRAVPDDFDLIIHCAAVVGGRLKIDGDPLAVATDLSIDSEFFDWVVRGKFLPKVVYFSSSAVYPLELQRREQHCDLGEYLVSFDNYRLARPDRTYGWAKLSGEYLAGIAAKEYGLDVRIYRPFGGYGEDQSFDYPFPSIVRRVLRGENPVTVWGSGEQLRDFIHIDDIVDGVLETLRLPPGEVLNLGTGIPTSFVGLAAAVCKVLERPARVVTDKDKPEGVFRRVADVAKMEQHYKPKVWLEQGILRVGEHLQKVLDGTRLPV